MALKTLILLLFVGSTGLSTCRAVPYKYLKLELVQVIFRHGERTPQKDEINVIGNGTSGFDRPWGLAQLTNRGKAQEYRIGTMLRDRYGKFLGAYHPDKVYAYSSGLDRTKMSLQLVLAGLYPPSGELAWNEDLKWMPIPTHFVPPQLDTLLYNTKCSKYQRIFQRLMNTTEMKNKLATYADVFSLLEKYRPQIKFNFEQLFYINNVLNTQQRFNLTMPEWYTPELHAKISSGSKIYLETLSYTPDLIRLNGGALTRRLVENMDVNGETKNPRKIYLYSGHEFNLYAVAKAHGVTFTKSPSYGSAIILEKLRDNQGKLYVKMYYWTGELEDENLIPMPLPNCDQYCRIEDYLNLVKPSLPSNDEILCLYKNLKPTDLEKILSTDTFSIQI